VWRIGPVSGSFAISAVEEIPVLTIAKLENPETGRELLAWLQRIMKTQSAL
jgi:hypothetical protein